jgi:hypothetical protein
MIYLHGSTSFHHAISFLVSVEVHRTKRTLPFLGRRRNGKNKAFASGKFSWVILALLLLAGHLGPAYLRNLCFRGVIIIPVTMRSLALGLQAALFIDSRLFIPMLHIVLLRPL